MESDVKRAAGDGGVSLQNFRNVPLPTATPLGQTTAGTQFIRGSDERHRSVPSDGEFVDKPDTDLALNSKRYHFNPWCKMKSVQQKLFQFYIFGLVCPEQINSSN